MQAKPDKLTIIVCGETDVRYPRDRTIVEALQSLAGLEVLDLRYPPNPRAGVPPLRTFFLKLRRKLARWRLGVTVRRGHVGAIVVMKNNHELVEWLVSTRPTGRQMPIFYDLWVSRALMAERDGRGQGAAMAREGKVIDLADRLIATTEAYASYYSNQYACDRARFVVVPLAVPQEWLNAPRQGAGNRPMFVVAYWGSFLKQHGLDVFLDAARTLEDEPDLAFRLYGTPMSDESKQLVSSLPANTTHLPEISDLEELISVVDSVDVGVGHLAPIHDSGLMLPNKAMEAMARGKPVIHIDAPELYGMYGKSEDETASVCFYTGGGSELAEAILKLKNGRDLAATIGVNARRCVEEEHSVSAVAESFKSILLFQDAAEPDEKAVHGSF